MPWRKAAHSVRVVARPAIDGDGAAEKRVADPGHIGGAGKDHGLKENGGKLGEDANGNGAEKRVDGAAEHDACESGKAQAPAAGQGIGENVKHIHARHGDDAEDKERKEPERLCVIHVWVPNVGLAMAQGC